SSYQWTSSASGYPFINASSTAIIIQHLLITKLSCLMSEQRYPETSAPSESCPFTCHTGPFELLGACCLLLEAGLGMLASFLRDIL
uniref:Uncharacterized protein n=1 Tax=Aegilops tauschii subsp. strangulata TaxID=200361 RepID=A0A453D0D8_AEGTS